MWHFVFITYSRSCCCLGSIECAHLLVSLPLDAIRAVDVSKVTRTHLFPPSLVHPSTYINLLLVILLSESHRETHLGPYIIISHPRIETKVEIPEEVGMLSASVTFRFGNSHLLLIPTVTTAFAFHSYQTRLIHGFDA